MIPHHFLPLSRGTNTFLFLLEILLPMQTRNAFTFFMAEEKSTLVVYNHSEIKYCSTAFTTSFPIHCSQYSIYWAAYTVYMLHIHCSMYTFIFKICLPSICGKLHFIPFILSQPSRSSTFSWMISQTSSVRTMPLSITASANFNFMSTLLRSVPKPFLKIKKYQFLRMRAEGPLATSSQPTQLLPPLLKPAPAHFPISLLTLIFLS